MDTLLELLVRIDGLGTREAVRFSNGLRTWTYTYQDLSAQIRSFAVYLDHAGLGKGDRMLLWCENRPEWIAVFWAALSRGIQLVPLDPHTSLGRIARVHETAASRLLVHGSETNPGALGFDSFDVQNLQDLPSAERLAPLAITGDDIVEILYTSGTTSAAKGVVHRHRNILANLMPIDREIQKYRYWARLFQPIRFLDVLPLSHMFGQSLGIFIPVLVGGAVVFLSDLRPAALVRTIRQERVSVMVSVPRLLATLESRVRHQHPETGSTTPSGGILGRWWHYRAQHRTFGWKFWAFVVGGAELDPRAEAFWRQLGYVVVQGYGLTETSPVVAVNHPFRAKPGTLGRAIGGQQVKIASDGEILVRGASVVDSYIGENGKTVGIRDSEGWFHTGDIGMIDPEGYLSYRGRKKDVIVTSDGLNVYPEDVERVLARMPQVRDSVVVAERGPVGDRPHAALLLEEGAEAAGIIREANRHLEPEQRIQSWSLWPEADFPRTTTTGKVQRHLVAAAVRERGSRGPSVATGSGASDVRAALAELIGRHPRELKPTETLTEDLALSSLERIDLLNGIEQRFGLQIDEAAFSETSTVGELSAQIETAREAMRSAAAEAASPLPVASSGRDSQPRWARRLLIRGFRSLTQTLLIGPLLRSCIKITTIGIQHIETQSGPLLFAANHTSHLDAPVIRAGLPRPWRNRLAPAVRKEFFFPQSASGSRWRGSIRRLEYALTAAVFHVYLLPQHLGQVRESLRYTGELISAGYCPLVFPEGARTTDGEIHPFRPGIGFMAVGLDVPVVPIYLEGIFDLLPPGARWPRRGAVRLKIGRPLMPRPAESYRDFTLRLESAVRSLG